MNNNVNINELIIRYFFFLKKNTIRYLVHANGICAGYSLLSAAIAAMRGSSSTMPRVWTFFCLDQVSYLILIHSVLLIK